MALSRDDLARYEALLRAARDGIVNAGAVKIAPKHVDATPQKSDEDADPLVEMEQAIASSRNRMRTGSLQQIDAALARLTDTPADFGLCVECEAPIPPGRLALMPHAELCVDCQAEQEEARRGPGGRRKLTDFV